MASPVMVQVAKYDRSDESLGDSSIDRAVEEVYLLMSRHKNASSEDYEGSEELRDEEGIVNITGIATPWR